MASCAIAQAATFESLPGLFVLQGGQCRRCQTNLGLSLAYP